MCGFAFIYAPAQETDALRARMVLSLSRLAHRGPDDEGIVSGSGFVAGHRRLSIIDLSGSRQPMSDPSGRYLLAFNGEVYNYRALRDALAGRWDFVTEGDTEVLLAGLIARGTDFIDAMEGMWAFALWDSAQRQLLLGRDRMGKKPLYFQLLNGGGIACASELLPLHALVDGPWQEDEDSTADYLRYGFYLPGRTAYRAVREVLPAHSLRWSLEAGAVQSRYWRITPPAFAGTPEDANAALASALKRAVGRRLVADVEVGAFLSGGVDSSLIVGLMTKAYGQPPKTFTIGFDDPDYDERDYARRVAAHFGTDHREEVLAEFSRAELERLVLCHVGQPFADSSLLPTAMVSRLAARHVKVALSGDGGDELFSGYQRYQARAILRWYTRLPQGLRRNVHALVRSLPEPFAHHSRSLIKKAHLFVGVAERLQAETPYVSALLHTPAELAALAPDLASRGHPPPTLPESTEPDDVARMMMADALVYLPQDILLKVDRASMAYGLEARAPFLDREVVELAFSLPRRWHRRGLAGKRMLRAAFPALLPAGIWGRRKQGFAVPVNAWFRGPLAAELRLLAADEAGPIRATAVDDMLEHHRHRGQDFGYRLWAVYVYLLWRRQQLAK